MGLFFKKFELHIGNFFAQYHFFIVTFVTSSFLAQFVGVQYVGYVFVGSSILVTLVLYAAPPIFRSFGTRNVLTFLAFCEITALLGLAISTNWIAAIILVTIQSALSYAIFIGIDLLIEAVTVQESATGTTRTSYLIMTNAAVLLASLSLSFVVVGDQYWRAFVTSGIVLIPFIMLALWTFPKVSFPAKAEQDGSALATFMASPSLRRITLAHLFLQTCFSWFSIYIPILLFSYELFSWSEIGIIMAIGMLPYLVLEYPLGYVADKWLGEKEILTTGFVILAIALFGMWLLHDASFWWWVGVMVLSRIGAAMVESMTEVHFFRHVTERDTSVITAFRALRPFGSVIGPLIASVALMYLTLPATFVVFAAVILLGIPVALSIVDTK